MKQSKPTYLLFTTIVLMQIASAIITWWAYDKSPSEQVQATNVYMFLNAVCWVFAFCIIVLLSTGLFRQLVMIVTFLWFGKVIDELFFDPCIPQWNDILNLVIAENIALYFITRHINTKK